MKLTFYWVLTPFCILNKLCKALDIPLSDISKTFGLPLYNIYRQKGEINLVIVNRIERISIKKSHPKYKLIDEMCRRTQVLYNHANQIVRKRFEQTGEYYTYRDLNRDLKTHQQYKDCGSQPANCTLRLLNKNWQSYFKAIKDWKLHPEKYRGMPHLPNNLPEGSRSNWMIPNNQVYYKPEENEIYFMVRKLQGYKWYSRCLGRLIQVRFVPRNGNYNMEIVYEIEIPDVADNIDRCISIDLGVNNLMTVVNNIENKPFIINGKPLKSINQLYNKQIAKEKETLRKNNNKSWSNKCHDLTYKRDMRIRDYIHKSTSYVIKYCLDNNIDTIIVGINHRWKQNINLGNNNQGFVYIPFDRILCQLKYKCENNGIKYIETEESYTSGTSFLDNELPIENNYNKERRIKRGLFKAQNQVINADVNAAYQIMKKVIPEFNIKYGIGVDLTPVIVEIE